MMHTRQNKIMMSFDFLHHELRKYPKHVAFLFDGNKLIAVSTNAWGKHAEMGLLPYLQRETSSNNVCEKDKRNDLYVTTLCKMFNVFETFGAEIESFLHR